MMGEAVHFQERSNLGNLSTFPFNFSVNLKSALKEIKMLNCFSIKNHKQSHLSALTTFILGKMSTSISSWTDLGSV